MSSDFDHDLVWGPYAVEVDGKPWKDFDSVKEVIRLADTKGRICVVARY